MASQPTRWGIAGLGKITNDYCMALKLLPASDHRIAAVAARDLNRAKEFGKKFDCKTAYGSYEDLAKDTNIDVVYIGTVHITHYEVCKLMINHGKNVLVEKPMALTVKHTNEILDLAKKKNVFFVEGFWCRFFPVYKRLKEEVEKKTIGDVMMINANFGFDIAHVARLAKRELGGGVIMDVGLYGVQFITHVFGIKPQKVVATGSLTEDGVDDFANITLYYDNNRVGVVNTFMHAELDNTATLCGSKGIIKVPVFWSPSELILPNETVSHPLPKTPPLYHERAGGFVHEAEGVRQCLLKGEKEASEMSHEHSRIVMDILQEARRQIGVVYDHDSL